MRFQRLGNTHKYEEIDYSNFNVRSTRMAKLGAISYQRPKRLQYLQIGDKIEVFHENKWHKGKNIHTCTCIKILANVLKNRAFEKITPPIRQKKKSNRV